MELAGLVFGTFWWWGIFAIGLIGVIAFVEHEKGLWAFLSLLATTYLLFHIHIKDSLTYLLQHPGRFALYIGAYFLAGAVWGVVKWLFFVNSHLDRYKDAKAAVMRTKTAEEIQKGMTPALAEEIRGKIAYSGIEIAPEVSKHKRDIILWMTYWPFSGIWTLINDPVRRIFNAIYNAIGGSLQRVSDRMFKTAKEDLEMAKLHVFWPPPKKESERSR